MLLWLLLIPLVLYLVFIGGGFAGIYQAGLRTTSVALTGLGLAVWLVAMWRFPAWRPRTVLWPAFAASLIVFAIGLALSRTPRYGADYLAYAVLLTGLYLILQRLLADDFFRPRILALAATLCLVISIAYIGIVANDWLGWWSMVGRIARPPLRPRFESMTFGNPAAVMAMCVLLMTPALVRIGWSSIARRVLAAVLVGLVLIVSLISGSRSPWLALAVAIVATGAVWLLMGDHRQVVVRALATARVRIGLGATVLLSLATLAVFGPGLVWRVLAGGSSERITFYIAAIRMFLSAPLNGHGPGTWVPLRIQYTSPSGIDYYIPHAHDIYLQTLAEFGLLGALAGLVVIGLLGWLILDGLRDDAPTRRAVAVAALFSSVYFGTNQLLDFYANMPAAIFAYAIPIAWLDATARRSPFPDLSARASAFVGRVRPAPVVAVLVASVVAIGWLGWSESSAFAMERGIAYANQEDWSAALPYFRDAAATDAGMPPYHFALGLADANTGHLREAAQQFEIETAADDLPVAWLDLAAVRARLGDTTGARTALTQTLRVGFQQPGVDVAAGSVYMELGEASPAVQTFADAIARLPRLAGDPWWQAVQARAALWPQVYAAALSQMTSEERFDAALSAGHLDQAASFAAEIADPGGRALSQMVLRAWQDEPGAVAALGARAKAMPLDLPTIWWCGRVAEHLGDPSQARAYQRWANDVSGNASGGAMRVRVAQRLQGNLGAGLGSAFYGQYTYRRPTPWDQLVSSLPHLVYE